MKIKITRADGTVIEATGSVEECERLLAAERPAPPAFVPYIVPTYPQWWYTAPPSPQWTYTTSEITVGAPPAMTVTALPSSGRYQ